VTPVYIVNSIENRTQTHGKFKGFTFRIQYNLLNVKLGVRYVLQLSDKLIRQN